MALPTQKRMEAEKGTMQLLYPNNNSMVQYNGFCPNDLPPGVPNNGFVPPPIVSSTPTTLVALIFKCFGNDNKDDEFSAITSGNLNVESTMEDVMK